jgi:hypothetical protein
MLVTTLLPSRNTLMIRAAVISNFRVFRMRWGTSPFTSGITATPVSKPDNPRASFGNTSKATATMPPTLPWA